MNYIIYVMPSNYSICLPQRAINLLFILILFSIIVILFLVAYYFIAFIPMCGFMNFILFILAYIFSILLFNTCVFLCKFKSLPVVLVTIVGNKWHTEQNARFWVFNRS